MKKIQKLKLCNWCLLPVTIAMLVSGIQLEATGSRGITSVWIHIAIGIIFAVLICYHIFLHFGKSNWFKKFSKQKSPVTRILWWVALATFITAIVSTVHWVQSFTHASIGGVHGKLGFLMIILSIGHICKRIKFFTPLKRKFNDSVVLS